MDALLRPAALPDLSPIENVWDAFGLSSTTTQLPQNLQQLRANIQDERCDLGTTLDDRRLFMNTVHYGEVFGVAWANRKVVSLGRDSTKRVKYEAKMVHRWNARGGRRTITELQRPSHSPPTHDKLGDPSQESNPDSPVRLCNAAPDRRQLQVRRGGDLPQSRTATRVHYHRFRLGIANSDRTKLCVVESLCMRCERHCVVPYFRDASDTGVDNLQILIKGEYFECRRLGDLPLASPSAEDRPDCPVYEGPLISVVILMIGHRTRFHGLADMACHRCQPPKMNSLPCALLRFLHVRQAGITPQKREDNKNFTVTSIRERPSRDKYNRSCVREKAGLGLAVDDRSRANQGRELQRGVGSHPSPCAEPSDNPFSGTPGPSSGLEHDARSAPVMRRELRGQSSILRRYSTSRPRDAILLGTDVILLVSDAIFPATDNILFASDAILLASDAILLECAAGIHGNFFLNNAEPRWSSGYTTRLSPRQTWFDSRWGRSRILACENREGQCRWSAGFVFRRCSIVTSLHPYRISRFSPVLRPASARVARLPEETRQRDLCQPSRCFYITHSARIEREVRNGSERLRLRAPSCLPPPEALPQYCETRSSPVERAAMRLRQREGRHPFPDRLLKARRARDLRRLLSSLRAWNRLQAKRLISPHVIDVDHLKERVVTTDLKCSWNVLHKLLANAEVKRVYSVLEFRLQSQNNTFEIYLTPEMNSRNFLIPRYKLFCGREVKLGRTGAIVTMTEWLDHSPPARAIRVQSPAGSPDIRMWESFLTMALVSGFSRGFPPFHSSAVPYSLQSPTSALKISLLRAAQISSLALHTRLEAMGETARVYSDKSKQVVDNTRTLLVLLVELGSDNIQLPTRQHGQSDGISSAGDVVAISLRQHKGKDVLAVMKMTLSSIAARGGPGVAERCLVATTGNEFSLAHSGTFHMPLLYSRRLLILPEMSFDSFRKKLTDDSPSHGRAYCEPSALLNSAGIKWRGKWDIPEKTRQPAASTGTIHTLQKSGITLVSENDCSVAAAVSRKPDMFTNQEIVHSVL
ncbi:hypothetical protein PR048_026710 [Dryococelus australis]|uniref:Uncharacterized protein n=1 Tax=Dryococelus australis TaxID=614101 RepID=A0ABQ9GM37_9NEOP|nr:hypothetical protein PR048_026710 [Dryococelus australis]